MNTEILEKLAREVLEAEMECVAAEHTAADAAEHLKQCDARLAGACVSRKEKVDALVSLCRQAESKEDGASKVVRRADEE